MEYTKPTYILFAGVNGSGKSTLFRLLSEYQNLPRINTDEMIREYGDWSDVNNQIKAARKAVKLIKTYLENRVTFNQETTLCGRSILKIIEDSKKTGYQIEIHYIAVESVQICKERIKKRVANGGHGIKAEDIERRYSESFKNMKKILPLCNNVYFYDNTDNLSLIAIAKDGIIDVVSQEKPNWLNRII